MCSDKFNPDIVGYVPLQKYFEKLIGIGQLHIEEMNNVRLASMQDAIAEARRVMETRMAGFPGEYAKKSELELTAVTLKDLKDRDLREIKDEIEKRMSRGEYDVQHGILVGRINDQEKRVQGAELLKAEVTGRIWTLGIVLSILVIGLEFIIKFVLKG